MDSKKKKKKPLDNKAIVLTLKKITLKRSLSYHVRQNLNFSQWAYDVYSSNQMLRKYLPIFEVTTFQNDRNK